MKNMFVRIHITLVLLCTSLQGQEALPQTFSIGNGKVAIENVSTVTKVDSNGKTQNVDGGSPNTGADVTTKCTIFWVKEGGAGQRKILEIVGKYKFSFNGATEQRFASGVWDVREVENGFEILFVKDCVVYRQKFWPESPTITSSLAQPVCSLLLPALGKGIDSLKFTAEGGILLK